MTVNIDVLKASDGWFGLLIFLTESRSRFGVLAKVCAIQADIRLSPAANWADLDKPRRVFVKGDLGTRWHQPDAL